MAKKLQSSLAVEGELPEDGLAAYGDDLVFALARKIVNGDEDEAETVFAAARDAEADEEEYLADDGWQIPEADPVVFDASRNGVEPEELAPESSGPDDEAQQTLFSWAEFIAEVPAVRRSRSRKRPEPSVSLFSWALTMEQEREAELVTASR